MPKNVLLILSDEFRADLFSPQWAGAAKTPHLDALAAEGALFPNAVCQAAPCAPSRMSLHTGRYMCSTGAVDNMTPLLDPGDNIGQWLRDHGVEAAQSGYNDYAVPPDLLPEGHPHRSSLCYDYFLPGYRVVLDHEYDSPEWYAFLRRRGYPPEWCNREVMYSPQVPPEGTAGHLPCHFPACYRAEDSEAHFLTSASIDFMEEAGRDGRPWYLNVNYIKPHGPYVAAKEYLDLHGTEDVPPPVRDNAELSDPGPYFRRMGGAAAKIHCQTEREWRELRRCYLAMVSEIDACVGRLMDALMRTGQWENTLVVFGADHGSCLGDHYLLGKPHFYDASIRVPLLVRDPDPAADATRGTRLDTPAENVDLAPTFCEYFGAPAHSRFQGTSLLPALRGAGRENEAAFFEYYYYNQLSDPAGARPSACRLWVCRSREWKYVHFGEPDMPPLLFNLENDPGELRTLAEDPAHREVLLHCARLLLNWRIRNEDLRMEDWARPLRA